MRQAWDIVRVFFFILGFFLKCAFQVFVFLPIYVLLCPYFLCDNPAEEDYYNYLNHFEDLI